MAQIIKTQSKAYFGASIRNLYTEDEALKSDVTELYKDDVVTNFSYAKDNEIVKVSGKVSDINVEFAKATVNPDVTKSFLTTDAKVVTITIDHSTKNNSNVDVVDAKDVLEYNTEHDIDKVTVEPIMKVDLAVTLSDGSTTENTFKIGDFLYGVTVVERLDSEYVIDCKVVAFAYSLINNKIKVNGLVVNDGNKNLVIPFTSIKKCGKEGIVVTDTEEVTAAIEEAMSDENIGGVVLSQLVYTEDLNLSSVNLTGNQYLTPANVGTRATDDIAASETVFEGIVNCADEADVVITGITFTKSPNINIGNAASLTFTNCKFVGIEPTASKSYFIKGAATEAPVLVRFDGCYFGNNENTEVGAQYNLFELNTTLADGSCITNCYFAKDVCTHNVINIYAIEDDAQIVISNNVFEYSANAIRIGTKGSAKGTIVISGNTYIDTDEEYPDYAGLLLIQPYGKSTESFADLTILLDDTVNESGVDQVFYLYCGGGDTQITGDTEPKLYVDGVLVSLVD